MRRYPERGLHGHMVDELGRLIVGGEATPGEIFDLDSLVEQYGSSRTAVREALKVLAGKGLLEARPKRGTYALPRERWSLLDPDVLRWQFETRADPGILDRLHEVRVMVEPSAAELAAARRLPADLAELTEACDLMAEEDADAEQIAAADLRFHRALVAATQNELIAQLSTVIEIGLQERNRYVHAHSVSPGEGVALHREVVAAIRERDAAAARASMIRLLEGAVRDQRLLADQDAHVPDAHPNTN